MGGVCKQNGKSEFQNAMLFGWFFELVKYQENELTMYICD